MNLHDLYIQLPRINELWIIDFAFPRRKLKAETMTKCQPNIWFILSQQCFVPHVRRYLEGCSSAQILVWNTTMPLNCDYAYDNFPRTNKS